MVHKRFLGLLLVLAFLPVLVLMASGRNDTAADHGGSPSPELTVVGQLPLSLGAGSISDDLGHASGFGGREPVAKRLNELVFAVGKA